MVKDSNLMTVMESPSYTLLIAMLVAVGSVSIPILFTNHSPSFMIGYCLVTLLVMIHLFGSQAKTSEKKRLQIPNTPLCHHNDKVSFHTHFSKNTHVSSHYSIDTNQPPIIQVGDVIVPFMNEHVDSVSERERRVGLHLLSSSAEGKRGTPTGER